MIAPRLRGGHEVWPETHVAGIGRDAVRCDTCGAPVKPFGIAHGDTVTFDKARAVGVTLPGAAAGIIAHDANHHAALPDASRQQSILTFAPSDMPCAIVRMRPFPGQPGTSPSIAMPDSHNAGHCGAFPVGAPQACAIAAEQLAQLRTDGHLDIDAVRPGAVAEAPVRAMTPANGPGSDTPPEGAAGSARRSWRRRGAVLSRAWRPGGRHARPGRP